MIVIRLGYVLISRLCVSTLGVTSSQERGGKVGNRGDTAASYQTRELSNFDINLHYHLVLLVKILKTVHHNEDLCG